MLSPAASPPAPFSADSIGKTVPAWAPPAGTALALAASRIRMIAATTPLNLRAELDRVAASFRGGREHFEIDEPRFVYASPPDHRELVSALRRAAAVLETHGELGAVFAARARELADEAEVCASAGTPALWEAARRRFSHRDGFDVEADVLALTWLDGCATSEPASEPEREEGERIRSDDERDPRSLVARMRGAIGARRLPLRVVVLRDLAPLAATGPGVIQIAAGRMITVRDVERTVLHEIEGHGAPGERSRALGLSIFAVGTARGSDDQEGRALAIERAAGFLDAGRRRELALRHVAARAVEQGAPFAEVVRLLVARGADVPDALRISARVHRGGGLAREAVYLPALLRVEAALREDPHIDAVLGAGRIAVGAAAILQPWVA